jgi:hypothetical protein
VPLHGRRLREVPAVQAGLLLGDLCGERRRSRPLHLCGLRPPARWGTRPARHPRSVPGSWLRPTTSASSVKPRTWWHGQMWASPSSGPAFGHCSPVHCSLWPEEFSARTSPSPRIRYAASACCPTLSSNQVRLRCRRRRRGPQVRQERGQADESIARSAPYGAAAPLPLRGASSAIRRQRRRPSRRTCPTSIR